MNGSIVMLAVNVMVALGFSAGFAAIALFGPGSRRALWFSAAYLVGVGSPVCDLLIAAGVGPAAPEFLGYASFLVALLLTAIGLGRFGEIKAPWEEAGAILIGGLSLRLAVWPFRDGSFGFGYAYQMPFMLGSLLILRTAARSRMGRSFRAVTMAMTGLLALNFATKPFFYVGLHGGVPVDRYTTTAYAVISQASTGILMLAFGVVLIVLVAQRAIKLSEDASETDMLSGLANRRGFDRRAQAALARATAKGARISVAVFDLDHFKAINDRFGHDRGDAVIARFASLLRDAAPASAIVGRMGGEEFAMLIEGVGLDGARHHAEAIRIQTAEIGTGDEPFVTVSGGVAEWRPGEPLADTMRRADKATYRAKAAGRNAIHGPKPPPPALRVVAGHQAVPAAG